jgi:predicted RND superfamily exporter protein
VRELLSGIIACGSFVAALHFFRSWRRSGDRLLGLFAAAFAVFAANGVALGLTDPDAEVRVYLYTVRLIGFLLILAAIVDKNRVRRV